MQVSYASWVGSRYFGDPADPYGVALPAPAGPAPVTREDDERVNEDRVFASNDTVVVLDGATQMRAETGCRHDVAWFVDRLGCHLAAALATEPDNSPETALARAIVDVRGLHEDSCDLTHADSPSATVAILRCRGAKLEYLVLCDTVIAFRRRGGNVHVVTDERLRRLPDDTQATKRALRNRIGGFWVAGTDPAAARNAVSGRVELADVDAALVLTDGVTRLVERYGVSWPQLFALAETGGPDAVLRRLRAAEAATEPGRFPDKTHDDATLVLCALAAPAGPAHHSEGGNR
ncbi:protein phosphatase 2C domain-containing protein [Micromonospora inyonensis]|uniref:Protein phosphatase 2C n=1 Tax=Micromonospora inyonensis TaxID=47866 RepID=A0A1C6S798_9ACTN|nr:protein phosphatase 2C domain-containing protein [Micromonospora inyonensis]SCL25344.1 Protein phosphatase 2C [Micromonospora inyonensis]